MYLKYISCEITAKFVGLQMKTFKKYMDMVILKSSEVLFLVLIFFFKGRPKLCDSQYIESGNFYIYLENMFSISAIMSEIKSQEYTIL
jgi:hypothetical protein